MAGESDFVSYGGGFFLTYEDLGRMFDNSFPTCAFFLKVEISSRTHIPLFTPGLPCWLQWKLYYWDVVVSTGTSIFLSQTRFKITLGPLFLDDKKATPDRNKKQ